MANLTHYQMTLRLPKIGGGFYAERIEIVTNEHGHIYQAPSWLFEPKPGHKKTTIVEVMHDRFWAGQFVWCEPIKKDDT